MKTKHPVATVRRGVAGHRLLAIAVIIGGASLAACEEDPVDLHEHDEGDVAGFRIDALLDTPGIGSRQTLLTYDGPESPDTLVLPAGAVTDIEIVWLDEHGDELEIDAGEHGWDLEENHSAIASFVHSEESPWQGSLTTTPLLPGATVYGGFTVTLLHGDDAEFETTQLVAAVEG